MNLISVTARNAYRFLHCALVALIFCSPYPACAQSTTLDEAFLDSVSWDDGLTAYAMEVHTKANYESDLEKASAASLISYTEICQLDRAIFKTRRAHGSYGMNESGKEFDGLFVSLGKSSNGIGRIYDLGVQKGDRIEVAQLSEGLRRQLRGARQFPIEYAPVCTCQNWVGVADITATNLVESIESTLIEEEFGYRGAQRISVCGEEEEVDVFLSLEFLTQYDSKLKPTGKKRRYGLEICVARTGLQRGRIVRFRNGFGSEEDGTLDFDQCDQLSSVETKWEEFENHIVPQSLSVRQINRFRGKSQYVDKAKITFRWSPLDESSLKELAEDEVWEANAREQLVAINTKLKRAPNFPLSRDTNAGL